MGLSKFFLNTGEALRPVLTKIIPMKLLSKMKAGIINNATDKLSADSIEEYEAGRYKCGSNIIGNIKGDNGLGQSARIMCRLLDENKEPHVIRDFFVPPGGSRSNDTYDDRLTEELPFDVNIIHVNASEFMVAYLSLGKEVWDYRYNIGYWAWELETFPEEWLPAFKLVDEVWTPSDFVTNTLKKYTDKPVITVPHCVAPETDTVKFDRKHFNLPEDKFLFLVMYNSGSVMERKNPLAAIKAFKEAFCKDKQMKEKYKDVGLVIKISEAELSAEDEKIIGSVIEDCDNIYYMCGHMGRCEVNTLLADVDVYVSLHRSEGFGLVMAESMYVGTPVIATDWSGNTEFMNSDTACMVGYDMIELDKDYEPFKKGNVWADAHVDEAADYMRRLYEDKDFYERIAGNGQKYAREHLAYKRSADIVSERLRKIHEKAD